MPGLPLTGPGTPPPPIASYRKASHLGPIDTLWHVLNFFAPVAGMALLAPALIKLLWRRRLASTRMASLSLWAASGSVLALLAGLVVFGRDGRMGTYVLMALCSALAMWWATVRR